MSRRRRFHGGGGGGRDKYPPPEAEGAVEPRRRLCGIVLHGPTLRRVPITITSSPNIETAACSSAAPGVGVDMSPNHPPRPRTRHGPLTGYKHTSFSSCAQPWRRGGHDIYAPAGPLPDPSRGPNAPLVRVASSRGVEGISNLNLGKLLTRIINFDCRAHQAPALAPVPPSAFLLSHSLFLPPPRAASPLSLPPRAAPWALLPLSPPD